MSTQYVPHITTLAGSCLTQANWQTLGIHSALCTLSHMLIKPGLAFWQNGMDAKTYLAWDGVLILDARNLQLNSRQEFMLQSPYDGSRVCLNLEQFWSLVQQLQPEVLLVADDLPLAAPSAVEILFGSMHPPIELLEKLPQGFVEEGSWFVYGEHTLYCSDRPTQDALQGRVYHSDGCFSIEAPEFSLDFQPLVSGCGCPTCQQTFTRAYLHHLFQSTPLLCQRLLMMHNVINIKTCLNRT